jgi:hypothetical protein
VFFAGMRQRARCGEHHLLKLTAGVSHILDEAKKSKARIRDAAYWISELEETHVKLKRWRAL